MKRQPPTGVTISAILSCLLLLAGVARAAPDAPLGGAPQVVSYQGQVTVGGTPYTGTGNFKFAVVDQAGTTSYWSNDGTSTGGSQPANAVTLAVSGGLFNVLLGDTSLANMTVLPATVFGNTSSYLRVWFSSDGTAYTQLSPDRRIAAAPYALQAQEAANADTLDGQQGSYYQSASNLTAGTLNNARFSAHSDLGAEGYLGDAPGDLAQNNGTLQTGLNADALDGHHASNASGDIPLSNDTLNADLNADLLDGVRAGNGSGYIALNNGIRNFNLNADMVDGSHAGNASGNVALNNGTVNTNLNADLLDGKHAGNANGNVPLSNGTLNTNLNADLFDGYHAGNTNGNVPLSNGTLNTGLNADLLDGRHASDIDPQHRASPPQANSRFTAGPGVVSSITIGADGLPVVSYCDGNHHLTVLHCGNAACTGENSAVIVDGNDSCAHNSIAIGVDGLPVISYGEYANNGLKVVHCGNAGCTSGNSITTVDASAGVGFYPYPSIAIGGDGLPVMSYWDSANRDLKVAHCGNVACTSGDSWFAADTAGDVGMCSSIAIGVDGLPVIAYQDQTNGQLKILKCGNATCNSGNSIQTPVTFTGANAGFGTSIAIGVDGFPVVSFEVDRVMYGGHLEILHCTNMQCDPSHAAAYALGQSGTDFTSITIGADSLPIVAYYDDANMDLKVQRCQDVACFSPDPEQVVAVDSGGDVGAAPAITIGVDGLPIISYFDDTNDVVQVAHCANAMCSPYFRRR